MLVKGGRSGDLLEVEFVDIVPQRSAVQERLRLPPVVLDSWTSAYQAIDDWAVPQAPRTAHRKTALLM